MTKSSYEELPLDPNPNYREEHEKNNTGNRGKQVHFGMAGSISALCQTKANFLCLEILLILCIKSASVLSTQAKVGDVFCLVTMKVSYL